MSPHTDAPYDLTRRRLLGALGTVGGAGAIGGAGAGAFVADRERLGGRLRAGALDARVGWIERYDRGRGLRIRERVPDDPAPGADPCSTLVDADGTRPVLDLRDVKPGDAGELRFLVALCSNPGRLRLDATLLADAERGVTEPERDDPDEFSGVPTPTTGDSPRLRIDNGLLDVVLSADLSGSLAGQPWLYRLPDGSERNVLFFEIYALRDGDARGATEIGDFVADYPPRGVPGTPYPATYEATVDGVDLRATRTFTLDPADALVVARYRFENVDPTARLDDLRFTQYVDFDVGRFSNTDVGRYVAAPDRGFDYVRQGGRPDVGVPPDLFAGFGAATPSVGHAVANRSVALDRAFAPAPLPGSDAHEGDVGFAMEHSLGALAPGETADLATAFALDSSPRRLEALLLKPRLPFGPGDLADALAVTVAVEPDDGPRRVAFEGSLAQLLALAGTGDGLALAGDCLAPAPAVHEVVLRWSLPVDHANELQTDAVAFDLGLRAEQCRHNPPG